MFVNKKQLSPFPWSSAFWSFHANAVLEKLTNWLQIYTYVTDKRIRTLVINLWLTVQWSVPAISVGIKVFHYQYHEKSTFLTLERDVAFIWWSAKMTQSGMDCIIVVLWFMELHNCSFMVSCLGFKENEQAGKQEPKFVAWYRDKRLVLDLPIIGISFEVKFMWEETKTQIFYFNHIFKCSSDFWLPQTSAA